MICNVNDKKDSEVHINTLREALTQGLNLTKFHKTVKFINKHEFKNKNAKT